MPMHELETVIAIPPLPFRAGAVDKEAHQKNLRFLIQRNFLDGGRRRVIGIAGTSLVHHIDRDTLVEVMRVTGETAAQDAVVLAGLLATPPVEARKVVERCMKLRRPPDYFLIMPVPGVCNPEGLVAELDVLTHACADQFGARFVLYMRSSDLLDAYAGLLCSSSSILGIKVGTRESDVAALRGMVPPEKLVLWGVGDRATEAARLGSRGHTSGITLICPRACDDIHNAYCKGDFSAAARIEQLVAEFEDIRFIESRAYNYSAVVAAAKLAGFKDVDLGEGGPFNAGPPSDVLSRIAACVKTLRDYH